MPVIEFINKKKEVSFKNVQWPGAGRHVKKSSKVHEMPTGIEPKCQKKNSRHIDGNKKNPQNQKF